MEREASNDGFGASKAAAVYMNHKKMPCQAGEGAWDQPAATWQLNQQTAIRKNWLKKEPSAVERVKGVKKKRYDPAMVSSPRLRDSIYQLTLLSWYTRSQAGLRQAERSQDRAKVLWFITRVEEAFCVYI